MLTLAEQVTLSHAGLTPQSIKTLQQVFDNRASIIDSEQSNAASAGTSTPAPGNPLPYAINTTTGQMVLLSSTAINLKTVATTAVYTPSGNTATVLAGVLRVTAASAITVGPTCGVGTNSPGTNIYASVVMTNLLTVNQVYDFTSPGIQVNAASGTPINFSVTNAATGTSMTGQFDLWGYLS